MNRIFSAVLRFLFGVSHVQEMPEAPLSEAEDLRRKIRKWECQAREYEELGLRELARGSRESLHAYRLRLSVLEDLPLRKSA